MILTCPECETSYFAEPDSIGDSGRTVKCNSCGHSWFVSAAAVAAPTATQAHKAYRESQRRKKTAQARTTAVSMWVIAGAVGIAMLSGLVMFRQQVVQAWPQSASTYAALGMPVNRFEIDFVASDAERFFDGTTPILEVRGLVANTTDGLLNTPLVRVNVLGDDGAILETALAPIEPAVLGAGAEGRFTARIEDPPVEAFELDIRLAAPGETEMTATGSTS
ncbi:MAG: MJ0042-type zinc finger domain-containing protein [Pseudomonadota bacterium]